jgi:hypothetical protein
VIADPERIAPQVVELAHGLHELLANAIRLGRQLFA